MESENNEEKLVMTTLAVVRGILVLVGFIIIIIVSSFADNPRPGNSIGLVIISVGLLLSNFIKKVE